MKLQFCLLLMFCSFFVVLLPVCPHLVHACTHMHTLPQIMISVCYHPWRYLSKKSGEINMSLVSIHKIEGWMDGWMLIGINFESLRHEHLIRERKIKKQVIDRQQFYKSTDQQSNSSIDRPFISHRAPFRKLNSTEFEFLMGGNCVKCWFDFPNSAHSPLYCQDISYRY